MISLPVTLWDSYWVHEHAGVHGNEIAEKLTRDGSVQKFVGSKPSLGVSRQNIRKNAGRITSIWQGGEVLAVLRDRLKN
jgi:hypothetical protein